MTNDIQDIKAKVRSLLMKAADAAASPSEAEGAMRAAQKLMAKYQVSEADLGSLTEESFRVGDRAGAYHKTKGWYLHPVDRYCAVMVGNFCGVKPWIHTGDKGELSLQCLGLESDVEMFNWMLSAFKEQFEHDWLLYKQFQMDTKRLVAIKEARLSFGKGFTKAVNERLQDWLYRKSPDEGSAGTGDGTSLIVKKQSLIEAEMQRRGLYLGRATHRGRSATDTAAAGAGYNSGKAAQAARATEGRGSTIMIGGR